MLRHCTIGELLEIRDGEGTAQARVHVEACNACRNELDRVHQRSAALRALPSLTPPRDRWPVVRGTFLAERRRVRWRWLSMGGLAAAAALVLAVGLRGGPAPEATVAPPPGLEAWVQRSRDLENALQDVGYEGRVLNGLAATAIADLEDRIAVIDAGIAGVQAGVVPARELESLWRQRVTLLDALVQTHVTRTAYVGF